MMVGSVSNVYDNDDNGDDDNEDNLRPDARSMVSALTIN